MAYSYNRFSGNGSQTIWAINFSGGYLSRGHVHAVIEDPATRIRTPAALSFVGPSTVSVAPAVPAGLVLEIYRDTPKDRPLVDFTDGAVLDEGNLDTTTRQAIFVAQEVFDRALLRDAVNTEGLDLYADLRMHGNDILDVGNIHAEDAIIDGYSVLDRIEAARATPADPLEVELRRQPVYTVAGTGVQDVPLLYPYDGADNGLLVFKNGVFQAPGSYMVTTPTSITFSDLLYIGDRIEIIFLQSVISLGAGPYVDLGVIGGTYNVDPDAGQTQVAILGSDITLVLPTLAGNVTRSILLHTTNSGGPRDISLSGATWTGGESPIFNTADAGKNVVVLKGLGGIGWLADGASA